MRYQPMLITFDIFGTVLDWRTGLQTACQAAGRPLQADAFDRIVDAQGELERGAFQDYTTITQRSLVAAQGFDEASARAVSLGIGQWPLSPTHRCCGA